MRRFAAMVLTVMITWAMTSCAEKTATPVTAGFACEVDVVYDEATYSGTLQVHDDGAIAFVLREPATVAGLTLAFSNEQLTMSLGGIELSLSDAQVPAGAVVRLLSKALEQVSASPSCDMQGELSGAAYTLRFDKESGWPMALEMPSYALSLTFSAWQSIE
ncbi:MAG: hypothetical protein IJC52_00090 [Clostridia bacterium]|nr:hypothetical protein [Clostridia bacterium]